MSAETDGKHPSPPVARFPGPRRIAVLVLYAVVLLLAVELAARLFWTLRHGTPLLRTKEILYAFYPELELVGRRPIRRGDGDLDVLILGGSVVNDRYGNVGTLLGERLTRTLRRPVKLYNLSRTGHTTLDSLFKYQHLEGREFDLVVVYHGINEARANNCPPEVFRDDYSHYSWYETIHRLSEHSEIGWLAFPFTFDYAWRTGKEEWGFSTFVPKGRPRPEWLEYGREVKTAGPFMENLAAILEIAAERGDPVLLSSFAYYLAPGYSEEAFRALRLDYSLHAFPVELWGKPPYVTAAIDAHNDAVARLAAAVPGVLYVDQNALIPKTGEYFNDVCHLTGKGCESFVDNVLGVVLGAWSSD